MDEYEREEQQMGMSAPNCVDRNEVNDLSLSFSFLLPQISNLKSQISKSLSLSLPSGCWKGKECCTQCVCSTGHQIAQLYVCIYVDGYGRGKEGVEKKEEGRRKKKRRNFETRSQQQNSCRKVERFAQNKVFRKSCVYCIVDIPMHRNPIVAHLF